MLLRRAIFTQYQCAVCTQEFGYTCLLLHAKALPDKRIDDDENRISPLSQWWTDCKRLLEGMLSSEYPVLLPALSSIVSPEACRSDLIRDIHRYPGLLEFVSGTVVTAPFENLERQETRRRFIPGSK